MTLTASASPLEFDISGSVVPVLNWMQVKDKKQFKYLRVLLKSEGRIEAEIDMDQHRLT